MTHRNPSSALRRTTAIAALALASAAPALAQISDDTIRIGIMGDMAEAPDTFDAEVFKEQAAFLAKDSANPWSHFENQEATGNATEAVWSNVDGFRAEADDFQKATANLNAAAQTATSVDQVLPALGQVGDSCKSCHTDFKVKKD